MEGLRPSIQDILGDPFLKEAFSPAQRREIREGQNNCCGMCGASPKKKQLEVHHKLPESMQGPDTIENGVGLCSPCHVVANRMILIFNVGFDNLLEIIQHGKST